MNTNPKEQEEQKPIFSHRFDPSRDEAIDAFSLTSSQTTSLLHMLARQFESNEGPCVSSDDIAGVIYAGSSG